MAQVKNICLEALERHCEGGETGKLEFRFASYEGQIFTHDHLIVHAQIAGLQGIPALFRLFDWGDAETTWFSGAQPEQPTLHLTMEAASLLYAENLQERAEIGSRAKDHALLAPETLADQTNGVESILKHYTISLECTDPTALPGGFTFTDVAKSSYVIGSSEDCDVILHNPTIDALHCGMILERGKVLIWDLGAQSGVKLNGTPVTEDILKVGDVMTLGTLDLRVRFQLRRPTIKPKPVPEGTPNLAAELKGTTGTMPMPKIGPPPKEMPKGPITYDKVSRQLKQRGRAGVSFLSKLSSLFGSNKNKK
jgi:hypothetical protein